MIDFYADLLSKETRVMHCALGDYDHFHRQRFDYLLEQAKRCCPNPSARLLDVGLSTMTGRLLGAYENVSTLGFPVDERVIPSIIKTEGSSKKVRRHIVCDLNDTTSVVLDGIEGQFDLIIFAEVLEHLYTAPEIVLNFLARLLAPGGYLIIQTPNAAALHKRLILLAGYNPYEKIRISRENPGHFREYTKRELLAYAAGVGLVVESHAYRDYFGIDKARLFLRAQRVLALAVPSFSRGQTLIARKPAPG